MKLNKLNDKLKYIKKVLKTPYHFFSMLSDKQVVVIFENKQGIRYTFTGQTMYNSTETAENYIKSEIEAGSLKDPFQTDEPDDKNDNKVDNENQLEINFNK